MKLEELREIAKLRNTDTYNIDDNKIAFDDAMDTHIDALLDLWEAANKIKHASWCDSTKDIGCGCDCRVEELSKALERLEDVK